jgi:hypothetical protein
MKASELRIGNLVDLNGLKSFPIESITRDGINVNEGDYGMWHLATWDEVKPIPLTEEWLLKLGISIHSVKEFSSYASYESKIVLLDYGGKYEYVIACGDDGYGGWNYDTITIDSVHQLQNLFFALTGEELTIN